MAMLVITRGYLVGCFPSAWFMSVSYEKGPAQVKDVISYSLYSILTMVTTYISSYMFEPEFADREKNQRLTLYLSSVKSALRSRSPTPRMRSNGSPKTCKTPRGGHRGHRGQLLNRNGSS